MIIQISDSDSKNKKYKAVITNGTTKKTIHFGAKGYSDYTIHGDEQRKQNYINRHKKNEDWNKINAGFLSRFILWNKRTIQESISDLNTRYKNIKFVLV